MATITSLSFAITSTYSGRGMREARRDIQGLDDGLVGMSKAASNIGGLLTSVTNAALLLGPALIPIATVSAGVAGGLIASAAAAGLAAGIFGGALAGAITRTTKATEGAKNALQKQEDILATIQPGTKAYTEQVKKVREAEETLTATLNDLNPAQRRYSDSVDTMAGAWSKFLDATEKDTLTPTSIAMDAVSRNLGKFVPVIKEVSPVVNGLAKSFAAWMDGNGLKRFINVLIVSGVPALANFIDMGRSMLGVFGKGMRAFLPYGNKMVFFLAAGARHLKEWADGGGFQRFMAKVTEAAPSVKEFLYALIEALKNIAKAAADLSGSSLTVFTVILETLALLPPELLANLVRAWLAWNAALIVYNVVMGIAAVVTAAMSIAASPFFLMIAGAALTVGAVVLALIALGVGIYFLIKYWDQVSAFFVKVWDATWNWIKDTALTVWDFLTHGWGQFVLLLLGPIGLLVFLGTHWRQIWDGIKTAAFVVWDALKVGWSAFSGWISDKWNSVWGGLLTAWRGFIDPIVESWHKVWPELKLAAENIWNFLRFNWEILWGSATAIWEAFWGMFGPTFKAAWQGASNTAKAAWDLLTAGWEFVWAVLSGVFKTAWAALSGAWDIGWALLTGSAKVAWSILTGAWSVVWTVVTGVWDAWVSTFGAIFSGAWDVIATFATGVWNVIKAAWEALWKVITAIFLIFTAVFTGHWDKAWTAVSDAVDAIWKVIRTAWQGFLNTVVSVFDAFVGVLSAAWRSFWNLVQSVALAAWNAFRNTFDTFLASVKNLWITAWNAIRNYFQTLINAVAGVAQAAWNLIRAGVSAFLTAIQSIWNTTWSTVRSLFQTATNAIISAATSFWTSIRGAFSAGSSWLRETFWNPVNNLFTKTIPNAFEAGAKALGKAWATIRKLVRDPIQAVVSVVYNGGIVKLWNAVAGVFGADKLSNFTLPAFAKGGPTGRGSSSGFPALLHPNEHVWTKDEVKGAGGHRAVAALRSQAMGGAPVRLAGQPGGAFEDGGGLFGTGLGPSVGPDLVPDGIVKDAFGKLKDLALGAISGPFGAAVDGVAKLGKSAVRAAVPGSDSAMEQLGVGMVSKIADTVKSWVKDHDIAPTVAGGSVESALAWVRSQVGKPYQWGGVGPAGYDCSGLMSAIQNVIMGDKPNRRLWATGAFSGGTAPSGWKRSEKAPFMVGITNSGVGHTAGTLNGVNVESAGGVGVRVGASARGYNNGMFTDWYGFLPSKNAGGATSGNAQATAKAMLKTYGWGTDQWSGLQALWQRESGWNYRATNPSSGAYGIPQALPANKMASAGSDWKTNAATQIEWGLGYIRSRYGSPNKANAFQKANNWYAEGTYSAFPGWGVVGDGGGPEVMRMRGGEEIKPLGDLVGGGGATSVEVTVPVTIHGNATPGTVDKLQRELIPKLTMAIKQGVGRRD
ncbi:hypothetical protein ACIP79_00385 [Streptomyces sp. NPDC088747]|uniref:aggregation-promoting factor C-terminal-like domain-containing protein n=1 Tax=Streptomyces sp. NPDC088747 TaxID=3365886 RepID=UPI0038241409